MIRHQLAKVFRLWGPLIFGGIGGFAAGILTIAAFGLPNIADVLATAPIPIASLAVSVVFGFVAVAIVSPVVLKQEQHRTLLARVALNNMAQGLCMFDNSARLVLCNIRFIEMYGLQRVDLRAGMPLREILTQRINAGTFSGDPDHYVAARMQQLGAKRAETEMIEMQDGRVIEVIFRPLFGGGWVATQSDVTENLVTEKERDWLRQRDDRRRAAALLTGLGAGEWLASLGHAPFII
jgi:PAS domain-containing protein